MLNNIFIEVNRLICEFSYYFILIKSLKKYLNSLAVKVLNNKFQQ